MKFHKGKDGKLSKVTSYAPRCAGYNRGAPVVIEFGISQCQFTTSYPSRIDRALSAPHPGYIFTPQYKSGNWDGHHHFITRAGYFPTGVLPLVMHILKTGINPIIPEGKKGRDVLDILPKKVTVKVPKKLKGQYYPGFEKYYCHCNDVVATLDEDTGLFCYPKEALQAWRGVVEEHVLSKRILKFAKSLYDNALEEE